MNWKELMQSIVESYFEILKDGLVGIYLHGSCAFGCESKGSDIDFIVVVKNEPSQEQKEAMINSTLEIEQKAPKKGLEMSVVLERNCLDFVYPTPYCLHYSRMHRRSAFIDPASYCRNMNGVDHDLAAHFTVIKKVGIVLYGEKIDRVFSEIPWENYVDSICRDIEDAKQSIQENPVYFILNLCRVWAACRDRLVLSKEQGGIWARNKLSEGYLPLLDKLLRTYRMGDNVCLSDDEKMCLTPLAELMMCQIELDKNR